MLWLKAFHLVFMVTWFAGLFYLPRLFVYHAQCNDSISDDRFKIMERKLYFGIMTPSAIATLAFGVWMLVDYAWAVYGSSGWLWVKLTIIALLLVYHIFCGKFLFAFRDGKNQLTHVFYRWFNEVPVLFLFAIIFLAVLKPI